MTARRLKDDTKRVDRLKTRTKVQQTIFGVGAGLACVCLRLVLQSWVGEGLPLVLAYPVTVLVVLLRGSIAGLACAVTCVLGAAVSFPQQVGSVGEALQAGALLLCVAALCVATHRWNMISPGDTSTRSAGDAEANGWLGTVVLAALVVPAVVFVAVAGTTYWQARRDAQSYAERTALLVERHAEESFRSAAVVARTISRLSATVGPQRLVGGADLASEIRLLMVGIPGMLGARLENARGVSMLRIEVGANTSEVRPADADSGHTLASAISPARFGDERAIALKFPGSISDTKGVGSVVIFLGAAHFEDYYQSLDSGRVRQARFELLNRDGSTLVCWPPQLADTFRQRHSANLTPTASDVQADTGYGWFDGLAGPQSVESRRRIEGVPVEASIQISRPQVLAGWVSLIGAIAAIMAPITAWLVCISWLALNRTRRAHVFAVSLEQEGNKLRAAHENALRNQKWETLATLTGGVAHDFNNLLSILLTNLHIHERRHPAQMAEPQMQSMLRTARSGVRLTQQLLSVSRKQKQGVDTVSLQTWLPGTAELLRATLGANVKLEYSVAAEAGAIAVDAGELELALINLSLNAKHAMPIGGTLTIIGRNARPEEGFSRPTVAVCAKDTGHGIPADIIPRIFEPFFSTKAHGLGTGLGLSQISAFVRNAGGEVRVESTLDVGTTVHMYFPTAEVAVPSLASASRTEVDLQGRRVLLVDSNGEVAQAVEAMLATSGIDVVLLEDADAAIVLLETDFGSVDAVLAHMAPLGGQDGLQLARTLRALAPRLPVILMTGYVDQAALAHAEAFEVVLKPIVPSDLFAVLSTMISARHSAKPSLEKSP